MASSVTNVIANRFPHTNFLHPGLSGINSRPPVETVPPDHLFYFRPVLTLHSVDKNQFHRLRGDLQL
jgi:hypothetical protein